MASWSTCRCTLRQLKRIWIGVLFLQGLGHCKCLVRELFILIITHLHFCSYIHLVVSHRHNGRVTQREQELKEKYNWKLRCSFIVFFKCCMYASHFDGGFFFLFVSASLFLFWNQIIIACVLVGWERTTFSQSWVCHLYPVWNRVRQTPSRTMSLRRLVNGGTSTCTKMCKCCKTAPFLF